MSVRFSLVFSTTKFSLCICPLCSCICDVVLLNIVTVISRSCGHLVFVSAAVVLCTNFYTGKNMSCLKWQKPLGDVVLHYSKMFLFKC